MTERNTRPIVPFFKLTLIETHVGHSAEPNPILNISSRLTSCMRSLVNAGSSSPRKLRPENTSAPGGVIHRHPRQVVPHFSQCERHTYYAPSTRYRAAVMIHSLKTYIELTVSGFYATLCVHGCSYPLRFNPAEMICCTLVEDRCIVYLGPRHSRGTSMPCIFL